LIFAGVAAALEQGAADGIGALLEASKVAGGDVLSTELVGPTDETSELEGLIAHDARVWGASGFVFVGKVLDDAGLEFRGFVDEVVRNAEFVTDGARICNGLRSTTFILGSRDTILGPEFEGDTDDVVALFEQKGGGGRGINSTAHTDCHSSSGHKRETYMV